ncbi:GSCOCG00010698001-RA-CDS, partial [Cotesia congregata]
MGQLPAARVQSTRAFLHTGLDYAGPITLKTFQGCGAKWGWIAVFVCMFSSAVHLEQVTDYTASTFIAAYRRFTSRRGICYTIYCSTQLAETTIRCRIPLISRIITAVKSIKFHLRRTIGDSLLTLEQYSTLLAQIEAILNSRPLTLLNGDPADLAVLTPGHFL